MPYTRFSGAEQAEVWDKCEKGDAVKGASDRARGFPPIAGFVPATDVEHLIRVRMVGDEAYLSRSRTYRCVIVR